ncbi:unnamed protein product [Colias eurytheme]|nr:unnamed protein product [Colias eurytheme]
MEKSVEEVPSHQAKKRKSVPGPNSRGEKKNKRYSAFDLPSRYPCRHNSEAYRCINISMQDMKRFHEQFYAYPDKRTDKRNVFSYVWTEDVHAKGSNELSSALYHCLQNNVDFTGIQVLRLMADGCSGQNKNSTTIGMISKWFSSSAPKSLKRVELIFPVTGHSFIPPDRVFGVTEKEIRKRNTIVQPNEYVDK